MFLPESIYNRIPQVWILMGLMFFSCGAYLGFEYKMIWIYLAMGTISLLRGIWVYNVRSEIQRQQHLEFLREAREERDRAAAEKKSNEEQSAEDQPAEDQPAEEQPAEDQPAMTAQSEPPVEPALTEQDTLPEMASEQAANDSVVITEPRAREPGEPVQYDPYDSLATRQHK